MCIVAIAWHLFDDLPLVILSNRDEFLDRSTTPRHQWSNAPIYAGRDNKSGGTWLGHHQAIEPQKQHQGDVLMESQNGRWAVVLNFRDTLQATEKHSRGGLVTQFLTSDLSPMRYAQQIDPQAYAGFNLIVGDTRQAVIVNNRGYPPTPLYNGLHLISNGQPDDGWFKCERLRGRVRQEVLPLIAENSALNYWQNAAWDVLSDKKQAPDNQLPDTGLPESLEKSLSSICIDTPDLDNYATRTQSILTISAINTDDNIVVEQTGEAVTRQKNTPRFIAQLTDREYVPKS